MLLEDLECQQQIKLEYFKALQMTIKERDHGQSYLQHEVLFLNEKLESQMLIIIMVVVRMTPVIIIMLLRV
jgi:hypothetical protein